MKLFQLQYFIAVAETLNFRQAAQRLNVTQPPLSRQIRQLEAELGVELFSRDSKGVYLTDGGRLLLGEARNLIKQVEHVRELVSQAGRGTAGSLRVGVAINLAQSIRQVQIQHTKRFPRVEIEYKEIFSTLQNRAMRQRDIDVGFMRPPVDTAHLCAETLFEEQFVVVLPKTSPLARRKKVRLKQLADQTLLLIPRTHSTVMHDKVLEMYRKAGLNPRVIHTTSFPDEAGGMLVASGKGIFVVPPKSLRVSDDLAVVLLDEPSATIEVQMAWRKGERSPVILNFIETARMVFAQNRSRAPAR